MMKYEGPPGFHADVQVAGPPGRPASERPWISRVPWLFVVIVVTPTLLASLYYLLIAAPLYVSEARFVVRSRSQGQPAALGSVLQSVGQSFGVSVGDSATDAFEVHEYMISRDAVQDLIRKVDLRALLDRPEADFLARAPRPFEGRSFETFYKDYKRFVMVGYDAQTGISTLRVRAFRAADAQNIATTLLSGGEALVNRLNDRSMADAVAQAQRQVAEAEQRGVRAEATLTAFRNAQRMIDPDRTSVAGLELIGKLETQLDNMRAERAGLAASAPDSPQLPVLDKRIAAFGAQLEVERARIAGEANSLAPKVGEYEQLILDRDIAAKSIEAAEATLESARIDARRKLLYLERVVSPDLPDKAEQPRRLLSVLTVLVSTLVAYGIVSLGVAGLREHRQQ
jgi:capsular polysaccharide transport system permease protein